MDNYIRDYIFKDYPERYQNIVKLNNNISSLKKIKRPFLIEFLGSCRSGKSTSIELISDVFRKNGLKVLVVDEEKVKETKSINESRTKKMNADSLDYTNKVIAEKIALYDEFVKEDMDIIIFDRGINDEFIWLNTFGAEENKIKEYDKKLQTRYVDMLIILTCDVEVSLKRKYLNSLSVMVSKWTNQETMSKYLNSLETVFKYLKKHAKKIERLDSSNSDKIEVALDLCEKIVENIGNKA